MLSRHFLRETAQDDVSLREFSDTGTVCPAPNCNESEEAVSPAPNSNESEEAVSPAPNSNESEGSSSSFSSGESDSYTVKEADLIDLSNENPVAESEGLI